MRTTYTLEQIFGTRSRVRVLRTLDSVAVPMNASQIASRTGLSQPAVSATLGELADMGLVKSASAGRANVHWLVRDNVYVEQLVKSAFRFESDLPDMLEAYVRAMFESVAESVVLFGSYARGDQDSSSDVDVVVVVGDARDKQRLEAGLLESTEEFAARWGAPLSVIIYDTTEAADLSRRAPAFYESLVEDGLRVTGPFPFEWKGAWGSDTQ